MASMNEKCKQFFQLVAEAEAGLTKQAASTGATWTKEFMQRATYELAVQTMREQKFTANLKDFNQYKENMSPEAYLN